MLKVTVVDSFHQEGGLSLRAWSEEKGRLSATALKSGLKEAGFKAGDLAYIITAQGLADAIKEAEERGAATAEKFK